MPPRQNPPRPSHEASAVKPRIRRALGGGCHTAFGAHVAGDTLHFFHEQTGLRSLPIAPADLAEPAAAAARILRELGLK